MSLAKFALATATCLALSAPTAFAQKLPDTMSWTAYDVGSAGYAEASAIADAFGKKFGTKVRIQPSGSAIGRLQPILTKRADVGFLATETFFATEGIHDFSARRWGPQNLRVLAGRPASVGVFTAADSGIKNISDLKGKRLALVAGNPSVNVKCEAFLAFANMDLKDVAPTLFPTYSAAMSSVNKDEADASCTTTTPSQVYELQASPKGIHWIPLPADDKEGWKRLSDIAPFLQPFNETIGAGISVEKPVAIAAYRYPMLVVRADMTDDEAYAFTKATDETFNLYKDATAVMGRWSMDMAGVPAADAPFHAGAIRYLKERGIWTDEHQAWNDKRTARLNALIAAWPKAVEEGKGKSDEEFAAIWEQSRKKTLSQLAQ
ncbi:TAXI family TRAP transporter solute-binding subunit [Pusillimonas sp. ANT_WB101]|uniref:TAXI family TRAP transporter solute-binding subunit n=1 Tax=Pusillimonas sp. ANT_WB101 TaxID=2597356 RepID=UPI0011ED713F|nr:TAXI family TRAP transporter solute-binding subunit [Pusillimonas sp. ANT_WB101]KAA0892764.1 TAXI family TRAP transporter solute-binding subunit [Pusillimonas sp. ANT_WB101]